MLSGRSIILKTHSLSILKKYCRLIPAVLEGLLRPAGFFRVKAERLTNLLRFILNEYAGDFNRMFAEDLWSLRHKLLRVKGIGEETADCILLYGEESRSLWSMPTPEGSLCGTA